MATISAKEFNRDVSAAKREAGAGPVVITDRGVPAYVLLSFEDYRRLGQSGEDLVNRLSMAQDIEVEFEPIDVALQVPDL